jgi:hypothetical protein
MRELGVGYCTLGSYELVTRQLNVVKNTGRKKWQCTAAKCGNVMYAYNDYSGSLIKLVRLALVKRYIKCGEQLVFASEPKFGEVV